MLLPLFGLVDPDSDVIGSEGGMERFFADLGVDPEELVTLIIAWQFKASVLNEFTRDEWKEGLTYWKYVSFPPEAHTFAWCLLSLH